MRAVVLQPTYLPWMGYFGLIDIADVFVFYDNVQFVRQSWQNRNRIKWWDGTTLWLTVPVRRLFGQTITEVTIDNSSQWRNRHWECIKQAYSKAPFFGQYSSILQSFFSKDWEYLVDLNMNLIMEICSVLGLGRDKIRRSSAYPASGSGAEKLINLLALIGADEYVSGPSAASYMDVDKLREAKIDLYWYEPEHPVYPQLWGNFVPYLSVIDLIFNTGTKSMQLIRGAARNAVRRDPRS